MSMSSNVSKSFIKSLARERAPEVMGVAYRDLSKSLKRELKEQVADELRVSARARVVARPATTAPSEGIMAYLREKLGAHSDVRITHGPYRVGYSNTRLGFAAQATEPGWFGPKAKYIEGTWDVHQQAVTSIDWNPVAGYARPHKEEARYKPKWDVYSLIGIIAGIGPV
ncbi:MAG: hypothetical protein JWM80_571 [Cyanobacteria bacterium RYN_339]|nr:hypothetical protein [Cyanobacteria bacterium RYN_339]